MAPRQRLATLGSHICVLPPSRQAAPSVAVVHAARAVDIVPHVDVQQFAVGAPEATTYLAEHGYVVFADVLTPRECEAGVSGIWDWLEALGGSTS